MISIFAMILPAALGHDNETEPSYPPYAVLCIPPRTLAIFNVLMAQFGGLLAANLPMRAESSLEREWVHR